MKRIISALLLAAVAFAASAEVHLGRYGVSFVAPFKLYNADGTLDVDESDGGTEVSVRCQGGTNATATNDFVDKGSDYEITLTATEMQCATVVVTVAATTTEVFYINTVNNSSAAIPTVEANIASATTGAIENQDFATTPGASGGLLIAGTNADFDVTANAAFAGGISITQSTSNTAALVVTGNGTGNGATFTSGSGATGNGIAATAASTNGNGVAATGTGTGSGLIATAGATGDGIEGVGGSTSGAGIRAAGTAGNSPAMTLVGQGSAAGLLSTGGATGAGISAVGGATSGVGLLASGSAGNSAAMSLVGQGSAAGLLSTGGATGAGASFVGGATSGAGLSATSTSGNGVTASGGTAGHGIAATGGATGHGMRLVGGATSGNGISTSFTAPSAGAPELGFNVSGTLSGTHSSTQADLGANAPGTVSDVVGHTLDFTSRNASRTISAYDPSTGIAQWTSALDGDITLTNADPWILYATAPASGGGSAPTANEVRDAILNADMTSFQTQGSLGQAIGDPGADTDSIWSLANTNLNATVSSRASQTSNDTIAGYLDTEVAAIKTKTDFLPSATAGASGGLFIAGTNAATTVTTSFTTTFTGNLTGSVGSIASGGLASTTWPSAWDA
jgi:hypothetical protein